MDSWQFRFEAIGTLWVCDVFEKGTFAAKQQLEDAMLSRIDGFDVAYSRFRLDSLVSTIAKNKGEYAFPDDARKLFAVYRQLYDLTDGLFTPLIGNVMEEIGYDASYSLKPLQKVHHPPSLDDVIEIVDSKIISKKPVVLDFGAGGKGYLLDLIGEFLSGHGIASFCLDAGGDIVYHTKTDKPLRVGLEHPHNVKQVIGVATILNQSICGSAGNRRAWEGYHHIMNPQTLHPVSDYLASWVVADSGLLADSLATAIMLTEPEKLQKVFDFEYLLLLSDFSVKKSKNFPAELYLA